MARAQTHHVLLSEPSRQLLRAGGGPGKPREANFDSLCLSCPPGSPEHAGTSGRPEATLQAAQGANDVGATAGS